MQRNEFRAWVVGLAALGCLLGDASFCAAQHRVAPGPSRPSVTADGSISFDQQTQLESCRAGILDPQARRADRRRWMELLFTLEPSIAESLVVELLQATDRPDVQQSLCEVIAARVRQVPHRLLPSYVEPLIKLLGSSDAELRSAAALAVSDFPDAEVPARLGQLASDGNADMTQRLGAIEALATKVDRREVIRELMKLLDAGVPQITDRVIRALEPAARQPFGGDVALWKAWWDKKATLSEEEWLADRLQMYRDRLRSVEQQLEESQRGARRAESAMSTRIDELSREVFRTLTGEEQQQAKLVEWLNHPLPVVQATAIGIIKARIADSGVRPAGAVLEALVALVRTADPGVKREALLILQTLKSPQVVDVVMAQLELETDVGVRQGLLRAAGKLGSEKPVPVLVREIASPLSDPGCVREAAMALSEITTQNAAAPLSAEAVQSLRDRYALVPEGDVELRGALLAAMAGAGSAASRAEFLAALATDQPEVLRPAIRGLQALGDDSELPRLRTLTAAGNPLIRMAATTAVAALGKEEADLESLLSRLNPSIESSEPVRDAAWRGFLEMIGRRPLEQRIKIASRLRETPDLEVRFLATLLEEAAASNGSSGSVGTLRERLAAAYSAQGKHAEAAAQLRELYESRVQKDPAGAAQAGIRWLSAVLRSPSPTGLTELVSRLAVATPAAQEEIVQTLAAYLESAEASADTARLEAIVEQLQAVPKEVLGGPFEELLQRIAERSAPTSNGSENGHSP